MSWCKPCEQSGKSYSIDNKEQAFRAFVRVISADVEESSRAAQRNFERSKGTARTTYSTYLIVLEITDDPTSDRKEDILSKYEPDLSSLFIESSLGQSSPSFPLSPNDAATLCLSCSLGTVHQLDDTRLGRVTSILAIIASDIGDCASRETFDLPSNQFTRHRSSLNMPDGIKSNLRRQTRFSTSMPLSLAAFGD